MLNVAAYMCSCLQEIKSVGAELSITPVIIRGEELKQKGLGGTVLIQFQCQIPFSEQPYIFWS